MLAKWHKEILTEDQRGLLPAVKSFAKDFGLVGGTAVALHIGHRESIDFDLFTKKPTFDFLPKKLERQFRRHALIADIFVEEDRELTFMTKNNVKVTFYHFEYNMPYAERFGSYITMPTLLTLAAMKAFAFGQRAKWKDYVDMYFIMRDHHTLDQIAAEAEKLFRGEFNAKLFRTQLAYFEDINYKEAVIFKPGFEVSDSEVKRSLTEWSLA